MIIGICGIGIVGNALVTCFEKKNIILKKYDKYKNGGVGVIDDLLKTDIVFICLPTLYSEDTKEYNKSSIYEICDFLSNSSYVGIVVVKSTIEPGTCRYLHEKYNLNILHNPEFLTAKTANHDFENQNHIVIGGLDIENKNVIILKKFYEKYWNKANISISLYEESELMKIGVNCFYAVKVQFFNEIYSLVNTFDDINYDKIIEMMLKNNWISPNHTKVPGTDGKISYGGMCFPKDTSALHQLMLKKNTPCAVLSSTISERNIMRK